jgi:hypothetical protein
VGRAAGVGLDVAAAGLDAAEALEAAAEGLDPASGGAAEGEPQALSKAAARTPTTATLGRFTTCITHSPDDALRRAYPERFKSPSRLALRSAQAKTARPAGTSTQPSRKRVAITASSSPRPRPSSRQSRSPASV